ncbi:FliI/YscN family ATPase [bacterium]|nr:FliI/YscN family ATPase [bacterium]
MNSIAQRIRRIVPAAIKGQVVTTNGMCVTVEGFPAPVGSLCDIHTSNGDVVQAEVVRFRNHETLVMPYADMQGIQRGAVVELRRSVPITRVGNGLIGRVINAHGQIIDGLPIPQRPDIVDGSSSTPAPMSRPRIDKAICTGVRAIDGILTCGYGQRMGIFAASGLGKSSLIGQLARSVESDLNVIVLVGERGREVREFLERELGPNGLARSIVVVATSDEPAVVRMRAATLGTAIAEYFRDAGRNVTLFVDSITRVASAQRDIGLGTGEPPATQGYPASVFSVLPKLLERSGCSERGQITAFYSVLTDGDDNNDPIAECVRGILDGHIVLSRRLAEQSHWPAIDITASISRSMMDVADVAHRKLADRLRELMAQFRSAEDLLSIGAIKPGNDVRTDEAIARIADINEFLQQTTTETCSHDETLRRLNHAVTGSIANPLQVGPGE